MVAVILADGLPMPIVGAVLSMVYVWPPVYGSVVLIAGDKPVELARFNLIVPSPEPVFTVTTNEFVPEPTDVMLAPLTPVVVNEKLLVVNPVTVAPKVTVY